jgi:hypothetical protein
MDSFIQRVLYCFHVPALLCGKDLYVDTYSWPCIVSYHPFFMRGNSALCYHMSVINHNVPRVKKIYGKLNYILG